MGEVKEADKQTRDKVVRRLDGETRKESTRMCQDTACLRVM